MGKYVDMGTDFGWKLYFGPDRGKPNLINFLNGLFEGEKVIRDLEYRPTERNGEQEHDRKVIFDLYCTSTDNSHFIIEMQQLSQDFIRDRMVYYSSRLIHTLVPRGHKGNTYELPEVYFIGVLDFSLDRGTGDQYYYDVVLYDRESGGQFYDKLGYKLLCLPNFRKEESEIKTFMDMWLYVFRYMSELQEIPKFLDKRVFGRWVILFLYFLERYWFSFFSTTPHIEIKLQKERAGKRLNKEYGKLLIYWLFITCRRGSTTFFFDSIPKHSKH